MSAPVFICSCAYGAEFVKHHGHRLSADIAARAGANGLEVRQELLTPKDFPLDALGQYIHDAQLACSFSSTVAIWQFDRCNVEPLLEALTMAEQLGAQLLKVVVGALPSDPAAPEAQLTPLARRLDESPVRLVIENGQAPEGGDIHVMARVLELFDDANIDVGLTFDTGNWQWIGEDATDAARALGKRVDYVHCKSVETVGDHLQACLPHAPHLAAWSSLWTSFRPRIPRAIEFPLTPTDSPNSSAESLAHTAHEFVVRLSHY